MSGNEIPKPSQLPAVVEKPVAAVAKVTDKDLDAACHSLGLIRFKSKTLKALKTVGGALESADMAKVQAASVVITQEKLQNLLNRLEKIIEGDRDGESDPQSQIEAVRAATAVCAELNRAAEIGVKILDTRLLQAEVAATKKHRGFAPGEMVQPIQVNIRTDGAVTVEGEKT